MTHIIEDAWPTGHLLAGIDVSPTLRRTCTVGLIRGGSAEDFAQALHEHWRTTETKAGRAARNPFRPSRARARSRSPAAPTHAASAAEIAQLDRVFVRNYPSILASAGLQTIRRRADSATQTSPPPRFSGPAPEPSGWQRYRRRGVVTAEQRAEHWTWATDSGEVMTAEPTPAVHFATTYEGPLDQ